MSRQFNGADVEPGENMKVGRSEPCRCGSGKKNKICCATVVAPVLPGLNAAIRMKGGIVFDTDTKSFRAVVHSWNNSECIGKPQEWLSSEIFSTDDEAMNFYKMHLRPGLERLMAEASRKSKEIVVSQHRLE